MCDAYVMHGDPPERIAREHRDMRARRERHGTPPMPFGVAGYTIVRDSHERGDGAKWSRITDVKQSAAGYDNYQQWLADTQLEQRVSLEDYSVSNRGLRSGLVGTPEAGARSRAGSSKRPAWICCCCSAARSSRRWSASRRQVIAPYRRSIAARPAYGDLSVGA